MVHGLVGVYIVEDRLKDKRLGQAGMGHGQVGIDADGLPLRLSVEIEYPQQRNGERIEAQIYTDFSHFDRQMIADQDSPVLRLQSSITDTLSKARQPEILLSISFVGLLGLGILKSRTKHIYAAVVIVVILSMVATPLLQGYQVHEFPTF